MTTNNAINSDSDMSTVVTGPLSSTQYAIAIYGNTLGTTLEDTQVLIENGEDLVTSGDIETSSGHFISSVLGSESAIVTDADNKIVPSTTTAEQIGFLDTLTSNVQDQLDAKISDSRQINTTDGIQGGGDLSTDLTLSLTDTGVGAGAYTNPNVTVDAKGRITNISNGGSSGVSSFNGRTGAVVPVAGDYEADEIDYTPTGNISATDVQAAIDELDSEKVSVLRSINTTGGIQGGGSLVVDRTLSLTNTGVTPGSYTNVSLTVDANGRITAAANGTLSGFANDSLSNLTTTSINADLLPDTDDVMDLGSSSLHWAGVYVSNLIVGSSSPFIDAAGVLTLRNVDAIDSTTESTIEAAMDTLPNVTSIQGQSITLGGSLTVPSTATVSGTNTGDQNLFRTIAVSGQSDIVADSTTDTLTFAAGANVTITTDASTDTVTISSTGGSGSPGGSNTQVQFNDSGSFGGDAGFTYNKTTDTATLVGGVVVGNTGLTVGSSIPFSDAAGTLTLQNIDALDATTESTIETAIDTLPNLTSIQGQSVTFSGSLNVSSAATISGTNTGDQNLFRTFAVSGQSDVVADSPTDTLTLVAGTNITITTNAATDSITINASGSTTNPGGADTNVQYNDGGSFGGDANLTWDKTSQELSVLGSFGLGTNSPGQMFHMVDGNFLFDGVSETEMEYKRTGTIGTQDDPVFAFGRIVDYGDGYPAYRVLYRDDDMGEGLIYAFNALGYLSWNVSGTGMFYIESNGIRSVQNITAGTAFLPDANDGASLGISGTAFSDLFLASGSVINWNAGDVTLTHSSNLLTLAGGNLDLGSNSLLLTGSIASTGSRVTKGWFTDLESTNAPTVGGSPVYYAGGPDVVLADGGTGASLSDPGADRIMFWDDSNSTVDWLTVSTGLNITGTTLTATGTNPGGSDTQVQFNDGGVFGGEAGFTYNKTTDTATLVGGVVVGNTGLTVGSSIPFSDSSGTLTLQNVDAIDATTESTIEAAIDTLPNLTSIQGQTVTFAGAFITSGANSLTLTTTGTTNVNLPTTGTLATLAGTETLSNKTLTAPKFADLGFIADANGNEMLIFDTVASAVNEITLSNNSTGLNPVIAATGETNVGIDFQAKGTGTYRLLGAASQAAELRLYEDTDDGTNYSAFKVGAQAANLTYTLPTALGAAGSVLTDAAGNGTLSWAAGGGGASFSSYPLLATIFENVSRLNSANSTGSGTASVDNVGFFMRTVSGGTSSANYTLRPQPQLDMYGKNGFATFQVRVDTTVNSMKIFIGIGNVTSASGTLSETDRHIGFKLVKSAGTTSLYASLADGSTENVSSALTTVDDADDLDLRIEVTASTSAKFYWAKNGGTLSSATTLTTNFPSGAGGSYFTFAVCNEGVNTNNIMYMESMTYQRSS